MTKINKMPKYLIYFQLTYMMFAGLLIEAGLPTSIRYVMDLVTAVLFVFMLFAKDKWKLVPYKVPLITMLVWWIFMVCSAAAKEFHVLQILWATRNWARFFVFFAACLLFLDKEDVKRIFRMLNILYFLNFILICVEFFFLHRKGDYLGGIFGNQVGCNGSNNILMCIALIIALCQFFEKRKSIWNLIYILLSSMVIASLEEIKIYFYEYILIIVLVTVLYIWRKKISGKELMQVGCSAVVALVVGLAITSVVFPQTFDVLMHRKGYFEYEETSSVSYKISRVKFIPQINELFFKDSTVLKLTGYGLGNCEYSKFDFLTSDFYRKYGDMNYLFFSHQTMYLEGGLIGLGLFCMIFVVMIGACLYTVIKCKMIDEYLTLGIIFGLVTLVNVMYNNATRTEISNLTYFALAAALQHIPKSQKTEDKKQIRGCIEDEG